MIAPWALTFSGMTRSPARVFPCRITRERPIKSISRQRNCLISQPRIVVLRASIVARYAVAHSGFDWAIFSKRSFSSGCSARPMSRRSGSRGTSSSKKCQRFARRLGETAGKEDSTNTNPGEVQGMWTSLTTGRDYKIRFDGDHIYTEWISPRHSSNSPSKVHSPAATSRAKESSGLAPVPRSCRSNRSTNGPAPESAGVGFKDTYK
jgi:hypothetical protein